MLENKDFPDQSIRVTDAEEPHSHHNEIRGIHKLIKKLTHKKNLLVGAVAFFILAITGTSAFFFKKPADQHSTNQTTELSNQLEVLPLQSPSPIPTPVPKGSATGQIKGGYYSKLIPSVGITLTNDQASFTTETNANGVFTIEQIPIGTYSLTATHSLYTFPPSSIEILEGSQIKVPDIFGKLTNPQPTLVNVAAFSDTNGNGQRDQNEFSVGNMFSVSIKDGANWKKLYSFSSTKENSYSFKLTDLGEYSITALYQTFYTVPKPTQTLTVDGYGGPQKDYYFALQPTSAEFLTKLYVFNDKNENGSKDNDEEFVHYQAVEIKNNTTGKSYKVAVPPEGSTEHALEFGNYTVTLVPQDSSWAAYFKITKGQDSFVLEPTSNKDTIVHLGAHKLY